MKIMNRNISAKSGFTINEVLIVLAIVSLLFMMTIPKRIASIHQQRYNDSVNDYANFLKNIYNEVVNFENGRNYTSSICSGGGTVAIGKSSCAFYGKLIYFDGTETVRVYDVMGPADDSTEFQQCLDLSYTYLPPWSAIAETTANTHIPFQGVIKITRSYDSGTISTSVITGNTFNPSVHCGAAVDSNKNLNNPSFGFTISPVDLCINSDQNSDQRRNIRILQDGRNASVVKIVNMDISDTDGGGNKCL